MEDFRHKELRARRDAWKTSNNRDRREGDEKRAQVLCDIQRGSSPNRRPLDAELHLQIESQRGRS